MNDIPIKVRDRRVKQKFHIDDAYLNGYARLCGWKATIAYVSLCRHVDIEEKCFPSIKLMAKQHSVSKDTIIDGIKILREWNIIEVKRQKRKDGGWKSNTYYLLDKSQWRPKLIHTLVANSDYPGRPQPLHPVANIDTKDSHDKRNKYKDESYTQIQEMKKKLADKFSIKKW